MILKSKLNRDAYQMANPAEWLAGKWQELDPVFTGRLAYYAKCKNKKIVLTEGYRSTERQTEFYREYLEYKRTGKGSIKSAAKPGTSWHEYRLAADISNHPIRTAGNSELSAYGLCKPIQSEGWHIQPLETAGKSNKAPFTPIDLAPSLKAKFCLSDSTIQYLEGYKYVLSLTEGLLAGKKDFSAETMKYLYGYKYWESLREKLGI